MNNEEERALMVSLEHPIGHVNRWPLVFSGSVASFVTPLVFVARQAFGAWPRLNCCDRASGSAPAWL